MALVTLNFFSEALEMQSEVLVIIPQKSALGEIGIESRSQDTAYKCLYLLHGLSDDHTIWLRRTSIERYASEYGICVVMPCGGRSFYCDMKNAMAYYTYIAKELPMRIREFFRVSDKREDTFVAGLSMGGYGALKIALKESDAFSAGAALSPCCDLNAAGMEDILVSIFGEKKMPESEDISCLARLHKNDPQKPRLYTAMGTEDFLYENFQPTRKVLESSGYDFTYFEKPGVHSWTFWDQEIQNVLKWMFPKE